MILTLQERDLFVKMFYENGDSVTKDLRECRSLKRLRNGPLTSQGLTNMTRKFEAMGIMVIPPGQG